MLPHSTALLLIDVQKGWDNPYWGERNNPEAEAQIQRLLTAFRQADRPVLHIQHVSQESNSFFFLGEPGMDFKPGALPFKGERVVHKHGHSAFVGTDLEAELRHMEIDRLVIAGFVTNWCVSSTARTAKDLGFKVVVVHDACATFGMEDPLGGHVGADVMHRAGLAEIHGAVGIVLGCEDVLKMV